MFARPVVKFEFLPYLARVRNKVGLTRALPCKPESHPYHRAGKNRP